jgi:large subunit ribosomal protein L1
MFGAHRLRVTTSTQRFLSTRALKLKLESQRIDRAIALVKQHATCKFDETVDIAVRLGVDPRKPNENVRGAVNLPKGTGKSVRVGVFARGEKAAEAEAAGAAVVGAEELAERILGGEIPFDRCIATPDMMPVVAKVARILGPRGLMPNPKVGTVTPNVTETVQALQGGQVEFRTDKYGIVHVGIGKASFDEEALLENVKAFMVKIGNSKPEVMKGKYFLSVSLSSTMGPGVPVDLSSVDPANGKFMRFDL